MILESVWWAVNFPDSQLQCTILRVCIYCL